MSTPAEFPAAELSQPSPPVATATLKAIPEDFRVWELLGFEPTGAGEFLLLQIEKTGWNTAAVSELLARRLHLPFRAVSYAGRKDRHAVTTQWFCLHLPGKSDPDLSVVDEPGLNILKTVRHQKKLRPGALRANRFELLLRDVTGNPSVVDAALERIGRSGVPNYFGPQRFGNRGANLDQARAIAQGKRVKRNARSMALSAARAWIFNAVLSERVARESWHEPMSGDVYMFADGRTCFGPEELTPTLIDRFERHEIDTTGPLWGRGEVPVSGEVADLERTLAARYPELRDCVEDAGMDQERRRLRLRCEDLSWDWQGQDLRLRFVLEKGGFATSVVASVFDIAHAISGTD